MSAGAGSAAPFDNAPCDRRATATGVPAAALPLSSLELTTPGVPSLDGSELLCGAGEKRPDSLPPGFACDGDVLSMCPPIGGSGCSLNDAAAGEARVTPPEGGRPPLGLPLGRTGVRGAALAAASEGGVAVGVALADAPVGGAVAAPAVMASSLANEVRLCVDAFLPPAPLAAAATGGWPSIAARRAEPRYTCVSLCATVLVCLGRVRGFGATTTVQATCLPRLILCLPA